ncbi:unnamed protein product [Rotaria sp. Silwood2]|nr:unnamed protein product [Rotaria sp. Silwood2]CAF4463338.1 unnamed protein product [Rotaria sp. Silwood2]
MYDDGMDFTGFGKSVAWLDGYGNKAVILDNRFTRSTGQWISSSIQLYDIGSDGFSNNTKPIHIYPNSQQQKFSIMSTVFIRLVCSISGDLVIFDNLGNQGIIFSAPKGNYPHIVLNSFVSVSVPCIRGTHRDYPGIELCTPCPYGTFSSDCQKCTSNISFCPYGSIEELPYSTFESIEQIQDYPDSPESTVFDDILMHNMFMLNWRSSHCALVSPMTWVLFWIGGLISIAIITLVISASTFSSAFYRQYPIETTTSESSFACDVTLRNSKFSTTLQAMPQYHNSNKQIQPMFDLLNAQQFYLKIDFIQTAFTCQDSLTIYRIIDYILHVLPITKCETSHNSSILSLTIALPAQEITIQIILPGVRTVGAIRIGLIGPSNSSQDGRYTLLELNFASTFIPLLVDQVLARSSLFSLQLTSIINKTASLSVDGLTTFSGIWSSSYDANTGETFNTENRYTFFKRTQTSVNVTITKTIFYISNIQEPIARQTEIIFRNFLFVILVLEAFGLLFLIVKLLISPMFRRLIDRWQKHTVAPEENTKTNNHLDIVNVSNIN